jgi:hypothetical protein
MRELCAVLFLMAGSLCMHMHAACLIKIKSCNEEWIMCMLLIYFLGNEKASQAIRVRVLALGSLLLD